MVRVPMSVAASALFRALLGRAAVSRDRIFLTAFHSTDWQSLVFTGERHTIALRIVGPDADQAIHRLTCDLADAEFEIPGYVVADIAVSDPPRRCADGSIEVELEALTIGE
jgi:hypothetical protein